MSCIPLDVAASGAATLSACGYAAVLPFSISSHWFNPNLTDSQKWIMTGYEVGSAVGGVLLTYAMVNFWNPTGWIAAGITILYAGITFVGSNLLLDSFEKNNNYRGMVIYE